MDTECWAPASCLCSVLQTFERENPSIPLRNWRQEVCEEDISKLVFTLVSTEFCSSFIFIAEIKKKQTKIMPNKKQQSGLFLPTVSGSSPSLEDHSGNSLKPILTGHLQTGTEKNECLLAHSLVPAQLGFCTLSTIKDIPHPNTLVTMSSIVYHHSVLGLQTLIN